VRVTCLDGATGERVTVSSAVAVGCDGTNALFYVDGGEKCRGPANTPIKPNPGQSFTLGLGHHTPRYFRGLLRDARIYCKALSPAEVADLARAGDDK